VTLLFGINNAGKSALLRALPLLGDSVGMEDSGPLDLESSALRGSSFRDLRWNGSLDEDLDPDLGIAIHWQDSNGSSDFNLALHWLEDLRDDWRRLVVRRFTIREAGENLEGKVILRREERTAARLSYEMKCGARLLEARIGFRGLLPDSDNTDLAERLERVRGRLLELRDRVQWLGATRRLPESRVTPRPSGPRWRLRANGEDAGAVLATQPEVLEAVSEWYRRYLSRRLVVREVLPDSYRLVLQGTEGPTFDVDLIDTGEGMAQVLSVLTALALRRTEGGPAIVAIEEPESHLHDELQRALAEELCKVAAESPRSYVVLETHSEHLLLGVQLQIARRELDPKDVLVYWVRQLENGASVAEPITFDDEARPIGNSLPPRVFSHDTEVSREIIRARVKRSAV
jgi:hypothetical protein